MPGAGAASGVDYRTVVSAFINFRVGDAVGRRRRETGERVDFVAVRRICQFVWAGDGAGIGSWNDVASWHTVVDAA